MAIRILVTLLVLISQRTLAEPLRFVTEQLPPLQMAQASKPATGAMVELINMMLKEAHLTGTIEFYPWARSYQLAQHQKNTFIFSILRDDTREPLFQWVGKIFTLESYLVALKTRHDIELNNLEDAKKYTVGSIRDDLAETYLRSHGFTENANLYLNAAFPVLWKMLYNGRTDLAFTNSQVWQYKIKHTGLDPSKIRFLYKIPDITSELYLAASPNTDKYIIRQLRLALDKIKQDGRYQALLTKWNLK